MSGKRCEKKLNRRDISQLSDFIAVLDVGFKL